MKKTNRNLLTVTAIAAALLLTGCTTAGTASTVRNLALNAKGTQQEKTPVAVEYDKEDNTVEYEYTENGVEYEVEADAATGEVKEVETEPVEEKTPKAEAKTTTETAPKATNEVTLEEAKKIAYDHAGVNANELYDVSAELDDGVYEIEFSSKGTEYDYKVSKAGEILHHHTEKDDDYVKENTKQETSKPESTTKKVTLEEAKKIAYDHAGVNTNELYDVSAELDDGVYEIEFSSKGTEYDYKVSKAGKVLSHHTEKDDDYVKETTKQETSKPESTTKKVTLEEAKKIAYDHAGVNTNELYDVSAELDDGVYEIEFSSKGTEYDYKVSKAGKVLSHHTEKDDDYVKETSKKETKNITKAKAKSIALDHAGLTADSIREYEIELDDGVYEVSFEKGRTEYEYKINAKTGEVLRAEKDIDD